MERNDFNLYIGRKIKTARELKGLSQTELAVLSNGLIDKGYLSDLENGRSGITLHNLCRILACVDIDITEIISTQELKRIFIFQ